MPEAALKISAGPAALAEIRANGFMADAFSVMAGASGGPKWLVLSQLDRVIAPWLLPSREAPVFLLGSSIGAWRFTCYAQSDPLAAVDTIDNAETA